MDPTALSPISPSRDVDAVDAIDAATAATPLRWVVFCRVIDNLGDIGVCWRLCADLAARGHQLQLWIDQPEALAWMAPGALEGQVPGVQVVHWTAQHPLLRGVSPAEAATATVWVEAFGCEADASCIQALGERVAAGGAPPVWINLEYLSAEGYVERTHTLPSPPMRGPAQGLIRWYFYPGFTERTGGLLREPDLLQRQAAFDALDWLAGQGLPAAGKGPNARRRVSLFCYEPPALPAVLQGAAQDTVASDWFVTPGRAAEAVAVALPGWPGIDPDPTSQRRLHALPRLTQRDFDHLLWSCDLNFVRGEDSLVRALWAGQPFVWHIYPQHDDAHHAKLLAFLDWLQAPDSLRSFHLAWNGMGMNRGGWPGWAAVDTWRACARAARERLLAQPDLVTQLLGFIGQKR